MMSAKLFRLAPLVLMFAGLLAAGPSMVSAANIAPTKVAIANAAKVFNEIKETKDLKQKMDTDRKTLEDQEFQKKQKIKSLQDQRDSLRPDSTQYADKNKELLTASIDLEVWGRMVQADVQREQKQQMKSLFDKITNQVSEVATGKGIDIVIAEQRPEWPDNLDQLNVDQLRLLINQRNVLFSAPQVDITQDVIAAMDAKYTSGH